MESWPIWRNLRLRLQLSLQSRASSRLPWTENAPLLLQEPAHCRILYAAAIPIINIGSFMQFNGSDSIRIKFFNRIQLRFSWLDSTQILWRDSTQFFPTQFDPRFWTGFNSVFSTQFDSRFLTGFDSGFFNSIWLTFNAIIISLRLIIRVPFQSGFRDSHIFQVLFEIIQHWNRVIFHNSDNSNYFWREHSKNRKIRVEKLSSVNLIQWKPYP